MKALSTKLREVNACQSGWNNSFRRIVQPVGGTNPRTEAEASAVAYASQKLVGPNPLLAEARGLVRIMAARGLVDFPLAIQKQTTETRRTRR